MSPYRGSVEGVLAAVEILSQTPFSWFGTRLQEMSPQTEAAMDPGAKRAYLVYQLQQRLYRDFYCQGRARPLLQIPQPPVLFRYSTFVKALSEANRGGGSLEPGWVVVGTHGASIILERGGLRLWCAPKDVYTAHDRAIAPGTQVGVLMPKENLRLSPGFYMALGNAEFPIPGAEQMIRYYWNLTAEGAATLTELLTDAFNREQVPFRLKVISNRNGYTRCDAGVLYIPLPFYEQTREVIERCYQRVSFMLKQSTSAFSKALAPGLSLAEDPSDGKSSFGMNRCLVLAEAIVHAAEKGLTTSAERLESVVADFANAGVDINAPFLNRGSLDRYQPLNGGEFQDRVTPAGTPRFPSKPSALDGLDCQGRLAPAVCRQVAAAIGRTIERDAIWQGDRCNWIGAFPDEDGYGGVAITYKSLGPDLYGGTSGVGMFLAELAAVTGELSIRRTALGALRHAASCAQAHLSPPDFGLYAGRLGVALALAYASPLIADADLAERARSLALSEEMDETGGFDLMSGHAGAIVGLLTLKERFGDVRFLDRAAAHGDALLAAGEASRGGLTWTARSMRSIGGLAGYSHGAAGAAVALLELASATSEPRYRDAAISAFAYERALYDPGARNWPDLRDTASRPAGSPPIFVTFWCHGAPGIALSRIRALELGESGVLREEAVIALETTADWTDAMMRPGRDYCLCHGLTGNAEILREGSGILGNRGSELAAQAARSGIDNYFARGLPWPSGVHGDPTPSLFLGDAGIGRFYLRLAEPALPSVLLIRPSRFLRPLFLTRLGATEGIPTTGNGRCLDGPAIPPR